MDYFFIISTAFHNGGHAYLYDRLRRLFAVRSNPHTFHYWLFPILTGFGGCLDTDGMEMEDGHFPE